MNANLTNGTSVGLSADLAQPTIFILTVGAVSGSKDGKNKQVTIHFDTGSQVLTGKMIGNSLAIALNGSTFGDFLHGFTAGRSMLISEGSALPQKVDLTGTSSAISVLGKCTEAAGFRQLPAPWHAPTPAEIASASQSTPAGTGNAAPASGSPSDPTDRLKSEPLASGTFDGQTLDLSWGIMNVITDRETINDAKECLDQAGGPLGLQLRSLPLSTPCDLIDLSILLNKKPVFKTSLVAIDGQVDIATLNLQVAIRQLDPQTSEPQVVVSGFSGGAHCCTTTIAIVSEKNSAWKVVNFEQTDGGYDFLNLLDDRSTQLTVADPRFDYYYASYSGSYAPTQIQILSDSGVKDVTEDPRFRKFSLEELKYMEQQRATYPGSEPNGFLAGWLAQKAIVGQLSDGWSVMLKTYDQNSTDGLTSCKLDKSVWVRSSYDASLSVCPQGQDLIVPFPESLALQLVNWGYMTTAQSSALGFDPASVLSAQRAAAQAATEAFKQHQKASWYLATNNGGCIEATDPDSPASLIERDKGAGLIDNVNVLDSDGGKPSVVQVGEPESGGLETVFMFYRGVDACQRGQQENQSQLENLK